MWSQIIFAINVRISKLNMEICTVWFWNLLSRIEITFQDSWIKAFEDIVIKSKNVLFKYQFTTEAQGKLFKTFFDSKPDHNSRNQKLSFLEIRYLKI